MTRQSLGSWRVTEHRTRQSWRKISMAKNRPDCPDGTVCDDTPEPGRTYTRATWPPRGRGRGESLTSPRRMQAKLRAMQVIDMRFSGATWAQIAMRLGFASPSGAFRAYWRMLDRVDWDRAERDRLLKMVGNGRKW